jgi:hypothetical protein
MQKVIDDMTHTVKRLGSLKQALIYLVCLLSTEAWRHLPSRQSLKEVTVRKILGATVELNFKPEKHKHVLVFLDV